MTPAITLGMGAVLAQEQHALPEATQEEQKPTDQEKGPHVVELSTAERTAAEAAADKLAQQERADQDQREGQAEQKEPVIGERMAQGSMPSQHAPAAHYLTSKPASAFRVDQLIGSNLKSTVDGETIGSINDLVIDADGQILGVIVEVGGFLGIGKKEVAISWDSIEHRMNEKGDEHVFTVSTTKDALTNAPEYKNESGKN
jgi:sporulation protein YlmC with PRC-barrel domain